MELKPGTRLVEDELTSAFNAGRTPVREALLRLQGEGLVSRDRGWIVEATDPGEFPEHLRGADRHRGLRGKARRPADVTPGLARLGALMHAMEIERPRAEISRINREFHVEMVARPGNPLFIGCTSAPSSSTGIFAFPSFS